MSLKRRPDGSVHRQCDGHQSATGDVDLLAARDATNATLNTNSGAFSFRPRVTQTDSTNNFALKVQTTARCRKEWNCG